MAPSISVCERLASQAIDLLCRGQLRAGRPSGWSLAGIQDGRYRLGRIAPAGGSAACRIYERHVEFILRGHSLATVTMRGCQNQGERHIRWFVSWLQYRPGMRPDALLQDCSVNGLEPLVSSRAEDMPVPART
ncbi:hypothetical protein JNJ66_06180 [Candidatus Saccharibacteria bacterium]|nr:hypothetical protein [Candidatus Saccharibacteria bacterium]